MLNELDWWVASQWEMMPTRVDREYSKTDKKGNVVIDRSQKWTMLREKSELKEIYIVRYADDFKIFCPTHAEAVRAYKATEMWLKDRLGLDISPDKSKVVNLKRQYSDFLGFKTEKCGKRGRNMSSGHICVTRHTKRLMKS